MSEPTKRQKQLIALRDTLEAMKEVVLTLTECQHNPDIATLRQVEHVEKCFNRFSDLTNDDTL